MRRLVFGVLVGSSIVGVAFSQAVKKQAAAYRELFQDLDQNRDNAIERDEVPASARGSFDRLLKRGDDNHNGKLEADEFRSVLQDLRAFAEEARKQAVERFKSMDRDGDGKLTREEFTGPKPRFDVLDRDGDGALTQQELLGGGPGQAKAKAEAKAKAKAEAKAKAKAGAVKTSD